MAQFTDIYNDEYAQRYKHLAATPLGRAIYTCRWALILKYIQKGNLLDYGCGPGAFNAHGSESFKRFNYDVNPTVGFLERVWETHVIKFDVLTMWDSIEHVPNFYNEIKSINAEWLFITTPNIDSVTGPFEFWKHRRKKEHIYYFEKDGLEVILEDLGYQVVECNYDEGKLRDPNNPSAILTIVARKRPCD